MSVRPHDHHARSSLGRPLSRDKASKASDRDLRIRLSAQTRSAAPLCVSRDWLLLLLPAPLPPAWACAPLLWMLSSVAVSAEGLSVLFVRLDLCQFPDDPPAPPAAFRPPARVSEREVGSRRPGAGRAGGDGPQAGGT